MKKLLFNITKKLPCRLINRDDGEPYLERYFVKELFGWRIYLHRFVAPDQEKPHNHPWRKAFSFVLTGGYWETRICPHTKRTDHGYVNRYNKILGDDFHAIGHSEPDTWTLFIHGPRIKPWGFMITDGERYGFEACTENNDGWEQSAPIGMDSERQPIA